MSEKNKEEKTDGLEVKNKFLKLRTMMEFGCMQTFHMKFKYLDRFTGEVKQEACQKALKSGVSSDKIQYEIDKEKYFLTRIKSKRDYFDYYFRHGSLALENYNMYPTNLVMAYARRKYHAEFVACIKCLMGELYLLKKDNEDVDIEEYEDAIRLAKSINKMMKNLTRYDNELIKKFEKEFFNKSDKQEVKDLYNELKSDELPFKIDILEEKPL